MTDSQRATYYNDNRILPVLKVLVYGWLTVNAGIFFFDETAAAALTHSGQISWTNIIGPFSATIDTISWVLLIYIFELETNLLPDHRVTPKTEMFFQALRILCYLAIVWSAYGYFDAWQDWIVIEPYISNDLCALVAAGGDATLPNLVIFLDDYSALDATNCNMFEGRDIYTTANLPLVGDLAILETSRSLALVDVINSFTWLVVVGLLELELQLQNAGNLKLANSKGMFALKGASYLVLFGCMIYWFIYGDFVDAADSFLWLFAFFIIELNILDWATEIREEQVETSAT